VGKGPVVCCFGGRVFFLERAFALALFIVLYSNSQGMFLLWRERLLLLVCVAGASGFTGN